MADVPKIVRERLRVAKPVTAEHPDPDVLTAFAESSLLQRERADVLEHLSRCGECREILVLALPASEPVQVVTEQALVDPGSHGPQCAGRLLRPEFSLSPCLGSCNTAATMRPQ